MTETDSQLIFTYTRPENYTLSSVIVINYERGGKPRIALFNPVSIKTATVDMEA